MSGPDIIIAAAATSLFASGASAYGQITASNQAASLQQEQIRDQQVQLRLQENQASIERTKKLQQVLATEEVTLGARGISAGSGTARGFTIANMGEYYADEHASKLNAASKQLALSRQSELVKTQRRSQIFNAATGFVGQAANTGLLAYSVPSQSLLDASAKGTANVSAAASTGAYLAKQREPFNLNA